MHRLHHQIKGHAPQRIKDSPCPAWRSSMLGMTNIFWVGTAYIISGKSITRISDRNGECHRHFTPGSSSVSHVDVAAHHHEMNMIPSLTHDNERYNELLRQGQHTSAPGGRHKCQRHLFLRFLPRTRHPNVAQAGCMHAAAVSPYQSKGGSTVL